MGSTEEKACKPEKSSSPPPPPPPEHQQAGVHAYPDWAAMQAYYGPRMAVPPYFNSAVAPGHAPPPYMWGPPQHMMPPYAAMYPHGGVYPHPGVPIATPMSIDSPAKSSGNSDRGLMKKLKGFDGLAMSIGNGNGNRNDDGNSHSGETEGSSEGSDGNTTEGGQNNGKRSREDSPNAPAVVGKTEPFTGQLYPAEQNEASKKVTALTISPYKASDSELKKSPTAMTSATLAVVPSDALSERELKRERRKQSNRESARRSRLRKQAEAEELAIKVEALTTENLNLKSEINRLNDTAEKLKLQNGILMDKLKIAQLEQEHEDPRPDPKGLSLSTANLLARVDNGSSGSGGEGEVYESNNNQKSGAKLRQLLDASPRADAVVAG
ncbi:hypothetical protein M8C21_004238 [Ambrosia artemisiifolia]|uniref:BZIP domain-containing protein n=1 Tax=Ambrosia artemisiifolia TaxID=4212 RepID=A0AAD5C0M7_AMBAR|nr:hypothetical protein M8C21_004238 [Ambrosia artemisiifolia]